MQDPAASVTALAYSVFVYIWERYRGVVSDVGVAFPEDSVVFGLNNCGGVYEDLAMIEQIEQPAATQ